MEEASSGVGGKILIFKKLVVAQSCCSHKSSQKDGILSENGEGGWLAIKRLIGKSA